MSDWQTQVDKLLADYEGITRERYAAGLASFRVWYVQSYTDEPDAALLTDDEVRDILDPKDVHGPDFLDETLRVRQGEGGAHTRGVLHAVVEAEGQDALFARQIPARRHRTMLRQLTSIYRPSLVNAGGNESMLRPSDIYDERWLAAAPLLAWQRSGSQSRTGRS